MQVYTDEHISLINEGRELVISDVNENQGGEYVCTVNLKKAPISLTHKVTIHTPPKVMVEREVTVKEGADLELICEATGSPKPKIEWELKESSKEIHSQGRLLLIRAVQPRHSNNYTCRATNSIGEDKEEVNVVILCELEHNKICIIFKYFH